LNPARLAWKISGMATSNHDLPTPYPYSTHLWDELPLPSGKFDAGEIVQIQFRNSGKVRDRPFVEWFLAQAEMPLATWPEKNPHVPPKKRFGRG
jgi:hypothetical protein